MATFEETKQNAQQDLQDLTEKYEVLEQELNVVTMSITEYKKEIDFMKDRNRQLVEENRSYQQLLEAQQHRVSFSHTIASSLDELSFTNVHLNIKMAEYKKLIDMLKSECSALKNENKKYKLMSQSWNEAKQNQERIYVADKSIFVNKIKELNEECQLLRYEISKMNVLNMPQEPHATQSISITPTQHANNSELAAPTTPFCIYSPTKSRSFRMKDHCKSDSASPEDIAIYGLNEMMLLDIDDNAYSLYSGSCGKRSSVDVDDVLHIKQSVTNEVDGNALLAKAEEIQKLKEVNNECESIIQRLQDQIKHLKQKNALLNQKVRDNTDQPYRCVSLALDWFS